MYYDVTSDLIVNLSDPTFILVSVMLIVVVFYLVPKFMDASLGRDDYERIDYWAAEFPALQRLITADMTDRDYHNFLVEYNRLREANESDQRS